MRSVRPWDSQRLLPTAHVTRTRSPDPPARPPAQNWANTIIAIDPSLLSDTAEFKRKVREVCAHVKSTGPSVKLPGEIEKGHLKRNLAAGKLDVSSALLERIREVCCGVVGVWFAVRWGSRDRRQPQTQRPELPSGR